jgi:hypothetical protein
LDTNFLISKLGYLDTVLTLAEQRPGSVVVLLPWVVIKELDGLKVREIFNFIINYIFDRNYYNSLQGMAVI